MEPNVAKDQIWKHTKKGTYYQVSFIANAGNSHDDDNNPPIVVYTPILRDEEGNFYHDGSNRAIYARKLSSWRNSFELAAE